MDDGCAIRMDSAGAGHSDYLGRGGAPSIASPRGETRASPRVQLSLAGPGKPPGAVRRGEDLFVRIFLPTGRGSDESRAIA